MKKQLLIMTLSLGLAVSFTPLFASEPLDRIVAVVNDDVVTQKELDAAMLITRSQLETQGTPLPSLAALQKQVLDQLINKRVQLQIAKTVGINVTDRDIDGAVTRIAEQNNLSADELYHRIEQEGFKPKAYRAELHDQITIQRLQQQEVISHITITPDEVTNFLSSQAWASNSNNEYHLEDILIPVSDTPSTTELHNAKVHAESLLTKIKKGTAFNSVAQTESASNALQGGDLGWRGLAEIPSAFADEVTKMKKGDIAGPIQTPNGFHILHLVDTRATGEKEKTPDRKQVENLLMQRKFEEAVQNFVSKLRGQAYVAIKTEKA